MLTTKAVVGLMAFSVALVFLGYCLDSDPPYPSFIQTVKEFITLCGFVFVFVTLLFIAAISLVRIQRKAGTVKTIL